MFAGRGRKEEKNAYKLSVLQSCCKHSYSLAESLLEAELCSEGKVFSATPLAGILVAVNLGQIDELVKLPLLLNTHSTISRTYHKNERSTPIMVFITLLLTP